MNKAGLPQFYRQRYILALLQRFKSELHRTDFQKYLFLANKEFELTSEHYAFLPYNYGPFSFQAYADLRRLTELGIIKFGDTINLVSSYDYLSCLKEKDRTALDLLFEKYQKKTGQNLIHDVYKKYPYYATKSKIVSDVMGENFKIPERETISSLFTIGYEGKTIDQYLNVLVKENISVLVDVRKNPVSMKYGYSKTTLQKALLNLDIRYVHMPELGIESNERQNLNSYADYSELFDRYEKKVLPQNTKALDTISSLYEKGDRVVLTCFERDKEYCHRSRISKKLQTNLGCLTNHL